MDFLQYITQNALILIPVLYIIGMLLRNTPKVPDWLIPWVLTFAGIGGSCAIIGFNIGGITQGILVAGATVYGNQLLKQSINRD